MHHTIALTLLRGLTQAQTVEILHLVPDPSSLFESHTHSFSLLPDTLARTLRTALNQQSEAALARAQQEVEFCQKHGIQILPITHPDYPQRLIDCADAPPLLYYRGAANLNAQHVLAVVGTRRITPYGKSLCASFTRELAERLPNTLVVSGLAYGVDIHAHRGCVEHQLPTVGVLAHGLDTLYPAAHRATAQQMMAQGGLLTEYASGVRAHASNFVRRNRIVAGMADATIVVESASHGGALITARLAADYERTVLAFAGRTTDTYSEGCNRLIQRQQALLITSASDAIELLGWETPLHAPNAVQLDLFEQLTPAQQRVIDALRAADGLTAQQLSAATSLALGELSAILFELEMRGMLRLFPGAKYRIWPS